MTHAEGLLLLREEQVNGTTYQVWKHWSYRRQSTAHRWVGWEVEHYKVKREDYETYDIPRL